MVMDAVAEGLDRLVQWPVATSLLLLFCVTQATAYLSHPRPDGETSASRAIKTLSMPLAFCLLLAMYHSLMLPILVQTPSAPVGPHAYTQLRTFVGAMLGFVVLLVAAVPFVRTVVYGVFAFETYLVATLVIHFGLSDALPTTAVLPRFSIAAWIAMFLIGQPVFWGAWALYTHSSWHLAWVKRVKEEAIPHRQQIARQIVPMVLRFAAWAVPMIMYTQYLRLGANE